MTDKYFHGDITSDSTDWGIGDASTDNKPCGGDSVLGYIKRKFSEKAGEFYYDTTNNRYMVFADTTSRDLYLSDPQTYSDLLLGVFDAPFNYAAEIDVEESYISVLNGTTGIYIRYTFDIKNKQGASVGDDVNVVYTFNNGGVRKTVRASYVSGSTVEFLVDDYIGVGQNTITIGLTGQNTLAATTQLVTVFLVDLLLSSTFDFATPVSADQQIGVPFVVKGSGVKSVEFYINGNTTPVMTVPNIVDYESQSAANINLANVSSIQSGVNTLQILASVTINGTIFHSKTLYYDFLVSGNNASYLLFATELGVGEFINSGETLVVSGMQYEDLTVQWSYYPENGNTAVVTFTSPEESTSYNSTIGEVYTWTYMPTTYGLITIDIIESGNSYSLDLNIEQSDIGISETTENLVVKLVANGRSNDETNKDTWVYNGTNYATFTNFEWNRQSGWDGRACLVRKGSSVEISVQPFDGFTAVARQTRGITIDIDFSVDNISNADATLVSCKNASNIGFQITSNAASMKTQLGTTIDTKFKPRDRQRICFTLHRSNNTTEDAGLMTIVNNGLLERAVVVDSNDSLNITNTILIGSQYADVKIYSIRIYSNDLTVEQCFGNYAIGADNRRQIANENNVYGQGTLISYDKVRGMIPTFVFTGDMIAILEATSKDVNRRMSVDYHNPQDPSKDFTVTNAYICPQGTSSLGYPIKNIRLYTSKKKEPNCVMYDASGNVLENGLYSFKDESQAVNCWTLKADYAESSMTHNTGTARLWNELVKTTNINGTYVLRSAAQQWAVDNDYPYDVRVSIDGFPCCVFFHQTEEEPLTFMGQFNFDNDKSTESVFGFKGLSVGEETFDNSDVACWECLNNTHPIALFTDVSTFDTNWEDAFEARYDENNPDTANLKTFATWVNSMKNSASSFATLKWEHLDVYKMAAYYIYAIRHGAVDQLVKNSMLTTEGYGSYRPITSGGTTTIQWVDNKGQSGAAKKYYYTWYDNDTIHGIDNDSRLIFDPLITRLSKDPRDNTIYAYAGHDSVLWNLLEGDTEFMDIVKQVDQELYRAKYNYAKCVQVYDTEQSSKWPARIYNASQRYKYIDLFKANKGNRLWMLQGSRASHRHWWLKTRFDYYDSLWVSGDYYNNTILIKVDTGAPYNGQLIITPGDELRYGYRINNSVAEMTPVLAEGQSYTFNLTRLFAVGDPIYFLGSSHLQGLNISSYAQYLRSMDLSKVYTEESGCKLKTLLIGNSEQSNVGLTELDVAGVPSLEVLDITNMQGISMITNLDKLVNLQQLNAFGSGLTTFTPADGVDMSSVTLPACILILNLSDAKIAASGFNYTPNSTLVSLSLLNCQGIDEYDVLNTWMSAIENADISYDTRSLKLYGIDWVGDDEQGIDGTWLCELAEKGWLSFELRGHIKAKNLSETVLDRLIADFGEESFNPSSVLYIEVTAQVVISGISAMTEGDTAELRAAKFPADENPGTWSWQIASGSRTGTSITVNQQNPAIAYLSSVENGNPAANITVRATYTPQGGGVPLLKDKTVSIAQATYPTASDIALTETIVSDTVHDYTFTVTGEYTGHFSYVWSLTGDISAYSSLVTSLDGTTARLTCNLPVGTTYATGRVTCGVKKNSASATYISKYVDATFHDDTIAFVQADNPLLMALMYATYHRGTSTRLAANSAYMTKTECASVTNNDLIRTSGSAQSTSIFYYNNNFKNNCTEFDELRFFTGLTEIPNYMLYQCNILSITLPPQITRIGKYAFYYCDDLASINIPDGVLTIDEYAFYGCSSVTELTLPDSITTLGTYAFSYSGINSINLPSGITTIPGYAFLGSSLSQLPNLSNVTYIGAYSFSQCPSLTEVTIPSNVYTVSNYAFSNCNSLISVTFQGDPSTLGSYIFYGCGALSSVSLPNNFTRITESMFSNCGSLTSITLPSSLTTIDTNAFGYSGLLSIHIPSAVSTIRGTSFRVCRSLASITVDSNNNTFDSRDNCNAIIHTRSNVMIVGCKNTTFPSTVTELGEYCFAGSGLTTITVPSTIGSIGNYVFYDCQSLTTAVLTTGILSLGDSVFSGCINLSDVTLPANINSIPYSCFSNTGFVSYTVPSHITTIDNYAFSNCKKLTTIDFNNATSIGTYVLSNCPVIANVTWPSTLTTIPSYTFSGSGLISYTVPNTITSIGTYAFLNCKSLTTVTLPTTLQSILQYAFNGCSVLVNINLPEGLLAIGQSAFNGCVKIENVVIPSTVTAIAQSTFYGCTILAKVTFGSGLTSIGNFAFYNCYALGTGGDIVIPASVTSIGQLAFRNIGIDKAHVQATTPPTLGSNAFIKRSGSMSSFTIYVPSSSASSYSSASGWSSYIIAGE